MERFLYQQKIDKHPEINVWFAFPAIESFAMASLGYLSIFKMLDSESLKNRRKKSRDCPGSFSIYFVAM